MRLDSKFSVGLREAYALRHEPESQRMLVRVVWVFCVMLTFCALLVSIAYGAWEFSRMPSSAEESTIRAQTSFSREDIEDILNVFDARSEEFESRLRAPAVPDPS